MASFFKKALSVFVEFDEDQNQSSESSFSKTKSLSDEVTGGMLNSSDAEKFEKHFDKLFDQANLPGPDYYEFHKMMDTLEVHIHDENARLAATFASLSIQGLTKQTLIDTANKYKVIVEKDKADFELALSDKLKTEVGQKQNSIQELEKKIAMNSEQIQKLTKEITDSQVEISKLKTEVSETGNKLSKNSAGYRVASQVVLNKITSDIQKIQSSL
jgi:hypothetical protein